MLYYTMEEQMKTTLFFYVTGGSEYTGLIATQKMTYMKATPNGRFFDQVTREVPIETCLSDALDTFSFTD